MPDLGTYAAEVLSAYAVSLALLLGILMISLRRAWAVKRALEAIEKNG